MNFYFINYIPRNKYLIVSDGPEKIIMIGNGTNRNIIKALIKKYTSV